MKPRITALFLALLLAGCGSDQAADPQAAATPEPAAAAE